MKILYVGHYHPGSTTRMRGEYLQELLKPKEFLVADIDVPMAKTPKLFRSLGWRYKKGPLISNIHNYLNHVTDKKAVFDLIWIDKGVFIQPSFLKKCKKPDSLLVHYTPDTAFLANESDLFYKAIPLYDFCITTKSFEKSYYEKSGVLQLIICTQGYDPRYHKAYNDFPTKTGIAFVGLWEPSREEIIARLLEKNMLVKLAGAKWNRFVYRHKNNPCLKFYGSGLFAEDYGRLISGSQVGLGLLSKKFPEQHTTRTFEIPACCTAIATEKNEETGTYFTEQEAIFFSDSRQLIEKIEYGLANPAWLQNITNQGFARITSGGYDYNGILKIVLKQLGLVA